MPGRRTDRRRGGPATHRDDNSGKKTGHPASIRRSGHAPDSLLLLQRGLTGDRKLAGTLYMDDPRLLEAYTEYYHEVSLAQVRRVALSADIQPHSVLDLGCGTGAASLALMERGARRFILVDHARSALAVAQERLELTARNQGVSISITAIQSSLENLQTALASANDALPGARPDVAVFSHSLNETGYTGATVNKAPADKVVARLRILDVVRAALAPDATVLVVEPATLEASRLALELRDSLLAHGWKMVAPCTRTGPCPALAAGPSHTCHDECRWNMPEKVARLALAAGLDRQLIKMTWFAFKPAGQPDPAGIRPAYRVVSAPMLNKGGRIRYLLCGAEGRFPLSAPAGDTHAHGQGFFNLGRYDGIDLTGAEPRAGGLGLGSNTVVHRSPLPLP